MKVPIGLPETAWESPDMISGLRELIRKHIQSAGTKSGHMSGGVERVIDYFRTNPK
jgi:hypothetical protein